MQANQTLPTPQKNEWDLILKLIPFLESNDKAIVHVLSQKKSHLDNKIWGVVRFKLTNYLAESEELEKILHILEKKHGRHIRYSPRKNQINISRFKQEVYVPEYHDDLPF